MQCCNSGQLDTIFLRHKFMKSILHSRVRNVSTILVEARIDHRGKRVANVSEQARIPDCQASKNSELPAGRDDRTYG